MSFLYEYKDLKRLEKYLSASPILCAELLSYNSKAISLWKINNVAWQIYKHSSTIPKLS